MGKQREDEWKKKEEEKNKPKEEEKEGEEKEKEEEKPEEEKKEEMEVEEEEKPVELTEEEKNTWFYKSETPDLTQAVLAKHFASFTLPAKEEGFDEIRFEWSDEAKCAAHLKSWMLELKKTQRA